MQLVRRSSERGHANHGWLDTYHSFSFDTYYDPQWMGFCNLRVLNEDRVSPGSGFPSHPHREMEIITYVLSGEIEHRDSTGGGGVLRHGEVQVMSAGTGIVHSELNPSSTKELHLLQIWIVPSVKGVAPCYDQQKFPIVQKPGGLVMLAGPPGIAPGSNALTIHADAQVFAAQLSAGESIEYAIAPGRAVWIQVAKGEVALGSDKLTAGDGAAITGERAIKLKANELSELLLFDLQGETLRL